MKLPAGLVAPLALLLLAPALAAGAAADAQITWAVHTTLVPTYFDPADTTIITSFMVLYARHDGVVKPMPGKPFAPSLAESWSASPDGLVYDFVLRRGVKFHNGEPVTAEDVKFSFERYRGIFARGLKERVASSSSCPTRRWSRRCTSSRSSTGSAGAWTNPGSGSSPGMPFPRRTRT